MQASGRQLRSCIGGWAFEQFDFGLFIVLRVGSSESAVGGLPCVYKVVDVSAQDMSESAHRTPYARAHSTDAGPKCMLVVAPS